MRVLKSKKALTRCKRKVYCPRFKYVPKELLTKILAHVGSSSLTDLFNAKIACKEFLEATSDNYVLEHVTLKKFSVIPWRISHNASSLLERCKESGNPEALFRQGMIEYFSSLKTKSGFQYLKTAANKGHIEAIYVYGIILVCHGGQFTQEGIKLLSSKLNRLRIKECRSKIKPIICSMWINNYIVGVGPDEPKNLDRRTCNCNGETVGNRGWTDPDEEVDTTLCDYCLWDCEAILFCNLLRNGRFRS